MPRLNPVWHSWHAASFLVWEGSDWACEGRAVVSVFGAFDLSFLGGYREHLAHRRCRQLTQTLSWPKVVEQLWQVYLTLMRMFLATLSYGTFGLMSQSASLSSRLYLAKIAWALLKRISGSVNCPVSEEGCMGRGWTGA